MDQDEQRDQKYREITEHAKALFATPFGHLVLRHQGEKGLRGVLVDLAIQHANDIASYVSAIPGDNMLSAQMAVATGFGTEVFENPAVLKHLWPALKGLSDQEVRDGWHDWLVANDPEFLATMQ